jgi:predicted double-glycine peptidase
LTPRVSSLRVLLLVVACGLGCASYQGTAQDVSALEVQKDAGFRHIQGVELVRQRGTKDCGSAALSTVLLYWRPEGARSLQRDAIEARLRQRPDQGLSARELRDYARQNGFSAFVVEGAFSDLTHELSLGRPVIVGVHKPLSSGEALSHYEVFIGYHPEKRQVLTLDPSHGLRRNGLEAFLTEWKSAGNVTLVVIPSETGGEAEQTSLGSDGVSQ